MNRVLQQMKLFSKLVNIAVVSRLIQKMEIMKVRVKLAVLVLLFCFSCAGSYDSKFIYVHYHFDGMYIGTLDTLNSYDSLNSKSISQKFEILRKLSLNTAEREIGTLKYTPALYFDSLSKITDERILSNDSVFFQSAYFDDTELLFLIYNYSEKPELDIYLRSDKSLNQFIDFIRKDTLLLYSRIFYPKINDENLKFTP